jgi:hypothetical protein
LACTFTYIHNHLLQTDNPLYTDLFFTLYPIHHAHTHTHTQTNKNKPLTVVQGGTFILVPGRSLDAGMDVGVGVGLDTGTYVGATCLGEETIALSASLLLLLRPPLAFPLVGVVRGEEGEEKGTHGAGREKDEER